MNLLECRNTWRNWSQRFSRFNCHECVIPPRTNCLYPEFCKRKNGEEEIIYDLEACEELLKDTYGITVYQEQVMLLSQKISWFLKGWCRRKAMGRSKRCPW
jgi:DNA polymerase III alpha subunit